MTAVTYSLYRQMMDENNFSPQTHTPPSPDIECQGDETVQDPGQRCGSLEK